MNYGDHSNLRDTHAILSASNNSWLRYEDPQQLIQRIKSYYAAPLGTAVHKIAAWHIEHKDKIYSDDKHHIMHKLTELGIPKNVYDLDFIFENLRPYVNDAIGYNMMPEQVIYFSDNAYGTADAICYRNDILRIHDLKAGIVEARFDQLEVYAAYYCMSRQIKPFDISIELRLYQNCEIKSYNPNPNDILDKCNKIIESNKIISEFLGE